MYAVQKVGLRHDAQNEQHTTTTIKQICCLGIVFDTKLKGSGHIRFICAKTCKRLVMTKKMRHKPQVRLLNLE